MAIIKQETKILKNKVIQSTCFDNIDELMLAYVLLKRKGFKKFNRKKT